MKIPSKWTFKTDDIAEHFQEHVEEQLPWYEMATDIIVHLARAYVPENGTVYDIGAATGNITKSMKDLLIERKCTVESIDNSKAMKKYFNGVGEYKIEEAEYYHYKNFDFCVMFLTLMFIKCSVRYEFVNKLRSLIKPGGALVIFDKCLPGSNYPSLIMHKMNMAFKLKKDISSSEILKKELSLLGIQRPISRSMFLDYGVEIFRIGDFSGWVIES